MFSKYIVGFAVGYLAMAEVTDNSLVGSDNSHISAGMLLFITVYGLCSINAVQFLESQKDVRSYSWCS
jgi:hypothetical protein